MRYLTGGPHLIVSIFSLSSSLPLLHNCLLGRASQVARTVAHAGAGGGGPPWPHAGARGGACSLGHAGIGGGAPPPARPRARAQGSARSPARPGLGRILLDRPCLPSPGRRRRSPSSFPPSALELLTHAFGALVPLGTSPPSMRFLGAS